MDLHIVDGLLEFSDELSQILRIDDDALSDVTSLVLSSLALDDVEVHVALIVLLDIEEISSVIRHEPG